MHSWCMRYEGKHKKFKKIAITIGNFKNIEKSVAFRHQRSMCHMMASRTSFLGKNTAFGNGKQYQLVICMYTITF